MTGHAAPTRTPGLLAGISLLMPITLSVMAALFVAPVAPKIAEQFIGHDPAKAASIGPMIEMIITVPSLCVALFSPFAGALGDRFGRRRLLILSMTVYSLFGVMPYFLNDLRLILASRVVVGIVEAMLMTLSTTLIGDYYKGEARNRWLAAQTGVASMSSVAVLMVAGAVGQKDWHNVFLLYLLPLVYLAMVILFTWEPDESEHLADPGPKAGWGELPWRSLGLICAITLLGAIMFYTVQIKLPAALNDLGVVLPGGGYDAARGARYTAMASFFVPVGTVCFWLLSPRATIRTQLLVEFGLMAAGFLLMARLSHPLAFACAAGLNQIGAGMLLPTLLTWAVMRLPFDLRGRGTGVWTSTFAFGQFACNNAAIPLIMGFTGAIIPTIGVLGWICLASALVAAAALVIPRMQTA